MTNLTRSVSACKKHYMLSVTARGPALSCATLQLWSIPETITLYFLYNQKRMRSIFKKGNPKTNTDFFYIDICTACLKLVSTVKCTGLGIAQYSHIV